MAIPTLQIIANMQNRIISTLGAIFCCQRKSTMKHTFGAPLVTVSRDLCDTSSQKSPKAVGFVLLDKFFATYCNHLLTKTSQSVPEMLTHLEICPKSDLDGN